MYRRLSFLSTQSARLIQFTRTRALAALGRGAHPLEQLQHLYVTKQRIIVVCVD